MRPSARRGAGGAPAAVVLARVSEPLEPGRAPLAVNTLRGEGNTPQSEHAAQEGGGGAGGSAWMRVGEGKVGQRGRAAARGRAGTALRLLAPHAGAAA